MGQKEGLAQEYFLRAMRSHNHYQKVHLHVTIPNCIWCEHDISYLAGVAHQEVVARERG
jgi:hypothetical protein